MPRKFIYASVRLVIMSIRGSPLESRGPKRGGEEGRGVNESTFRQTLFPQMQPVERFDILGRNVWMQLVERLFKEIARIGNVSGNRDGAMIMIMVKGKW